MMYHTKALVLSKGEWREADCLVAALTPDFGKIRLLAQGARKHGAKLQGHLEPAAASDISFVIGRNGYRLTTARLVSFPRSVRASLAKLRAVSAVLAAIDRNVLEERDRAAVLFSAASAAISSIEAADNPAAVERLLTWFYVRLLAFLGLFPSPHTPEALGIPGLFLLAGLEARDLASAAVAEAALQLEFDRLRERLGDAVRLPNSVAAMPAGLY